MMWRCEQRNIGFARASPPAHGCRGGRETSVQKKPTKKQTAHLAVCYQKVLICVGKKNLSSKVQVPQRCKYCKYFSVLWLINASGNINSTLTLRRKKNRLELHSVASRASLGTSRVELGKCLELIHRENLISTGICCEHPVVAQNVFLVVGTGKKLRRLQRRLGFILRASRLSLESKIPL